MGEGRLTCGEGRADLWGEGRLTCGGRGRLTCRGAPALCPRLVTPALFPVLCAGTCRGQGSGG